TARWLSQRKSPKDPALLPPLMLLGFTKYPSLLVERETVRRVCGLKFSPDDANGPPVIGVSSVVPPGAHVNYWESHNIVTFLVFCARRTAFWASERSANNLVIMMGILQLS